MRKTGLWLLRSHNVLVRSGAALRGPADLLREAGPALGGCHLYPQSSFTEAPAVMSFLGPKDESQGRKAPAQASCPETATLGAANTRSCSHPCHLPKAA